MRVIFSIWRNKSWTTIVGRQKSIAIADGLVTRPAVIMLGVKVLGAFFLFELAIAFHGFLIV